ncbi:hypothetical protein BaRGS_00010998 [Batillaria attramentaria]|uniref:Meiosis-specific nuclear structural protein 1 n=1 Tax=Batillaria attramentaria TaxID=370345 RepID=A0ABD0LE78_9CAEN
MLLKAVLYQRFIDLILSPSLSSLSLLSVYATRITASEKSKLATTHVSANLREQMVQKTRRQENAREDRVKNLERERVMAAAIRGEDKGAEKRFIRTLHEMKHEQEMEDSILRAERDRMIREQQFAQEESLARELERRRLEETKDEKMRQQIRETSLELRELEAKLKAAYMNKERAAQLAEKDALKFDEMKRDSEIARHMKEQAERAQEAEREREMERYREMVRYQQELERQLEEQEQKRQQAYEEFLKEKLMIDEIVRRIYEEDQRELEREMGKKKLTQKYIAEFKKARDEMQRDRESDQAAQKQAKEDALNRVQRALSEQIAAKEREREEMERVRLELHLEEQEEKERQQEKMDMENRIRQRIELQHTHAQQMHFKALRIQAEKEEEDQFRQQMLAKFAEDDRIEQMNAQKRRMKQQEHKRAVEALLEERRSQYAAEREREAYERAEEQRMEEFRKQIIEEERKRLLREHATRLLGYLPKGVIQGDEDLEMLGPEFRDAYTRRQIDPFDEAAWDQPR